MKTQTRHRVYVASSWRNVIQPNVVEILRADGHDVYDFKNPDPGNPSQKGFSWKSLEFGETKTWTPEVYAREVLDHPVAAEGFEADMRALDAASVCVFVLPCGRSASLELGYAVGRGKLTVVYVPELDEPELMYRMCDYVETTIDGVRLALSQQRPRPRWQRDLAAFDKRGVIGGNEYCGPLPCALTKTSYRTSDEKILDGPLPERGPCREYHHRSCVVCGGCWRHGACTCGPRALLP